MTDKTDKTEKRIETYRDRLENLLDLELTKIYEAKTDKDRIYRTVRYNVLNSEYHNITGKYHKQVESDEDDRAR